MKYVAAYALLALGGNAHPTNEQVAHLIESVSGTVDQAKLTALHHSLVGKDLNEIIRLGLGKVGSIGASSSAPAAVVAPVVSAPKKEEPKKEEPKKEEEDFEGAGDLFDF